MGGYQGTRDQVLFLAMETQQKGGPSQGELRRVELVLSGGKGAYMGNGASCMNQSMHYWKGML